MDIENLYRQVIMDHYKYPRNKGLIDDPTYMTVHLNNPSCGDEMTVQIKLDDKQNIVDVKHQGTGCSICCSSASVMSEAIKGHSVDESERMIHEFYEMIKGYPFNDQILKGDAIAYKGVSQFPARVKCATLAWKACEQGIIKMKEEENK